MITLDEWIAQIESARRILPVAVAGEVRAAALAMAEAAKDYIGEEQPGRTISTPIAAHVPAWDPLAPRTLADKRALGIDKADGAPLLRTGQMRASIIGVSEGGTGAVVSEDPVALWQEMGTGSGIPPRSFLARAVIEGLPLLAVRFGMLARDLLEGKR